MTSLTAVIVAVVVGISDGDTLTVLDDQRQQIKVRLAEIDAPEKAQPFGQRSKQSLSEICYKARVKLHVQTRDRYGRVVARVTCDGVDANAEQVRRGMAWVYRQYASDRELYAIEDDVRRSLRGLWRDIDPVPPWEWRRKK